MTELPLVSSAPTSSRPTTAVDLVDATPKVGQSWREIKSPHRTVTILEVHVGCVGWVSGSTYSGCNNNAALVSNQETGVTSRIKEQRLVAGWQLIPPQTFPESVLIVATRALVTAWCGPVVRIAPNRVPEPIVWLGRDADDLSHVYLDLRLPECRDLVARRLCITTPISPEVAAELAGTSRRAWESHTKLKPPEDGFVTPSTRGG